MMYAYVTRLHTVSPTSQHSSTTLLYLKHRYLGLTVVQLSPVDAAASDRTKSTEPFTFPLRAIVPLRMPSTRE